MQLNRFERLVVNQPLRPWLQAWIEAPPLRRMGGRLDGMCVLELGCGQGEGQRILRRDFGAAAVHGCDLDPRQLARARSRLAPDSNLSWTHANAQQLPYASAGFDAVVSFNALHHVPDWQSALAEAKRVLRPGGRLLLLETLRGFLQAPPMRQLMEHPRENRFDALQLRTELERLGFAIDGTRRIPGCFLWLAAHLQ